MTDFAATDIHKKRAADWFQSLRDQICAAFESIEQDYDGPDCDKAAAPGTFDYTNWERPGGGGGTIGKMKGRVFEKVGVNFSAVEGEFSDQFAKEIPGATENPHFWASGISLVAHMRNPFVPPVHMNTRHLITTQHWFGGGADLNGIYPFDEDVAAFHNRLKQACDATDEAYYPKFKAWADEYFFIPHRDEPRGQGGIFYDRLSSGPTEQDWERDFKFTQDVGTAFLDAFPAIVRNRMDTPYERKHREFQAYKRGRYVEFNLLHDRGTRFGIMTNGNPDAILMSLPPMATWD